jgi:hypothetical protein
MTVAEYGLVAPAIVLAGGSLIFLAFLVVFFFAVVFGYYTVKGSGISQTPYRRDGGPPESPSELAHDITQNVWDWGRGTAGHHGRHRPPPVLEPINRGVADALRRWRRGERTEFRLVPPVGPDDRARGPEGATTVAIYIDLVSEPCRRTYQLLNDLRRRRPIRLAVRHLPLADVHPLALPAAETLEAARAQGRFFELLDQLTLSAFHDKAELLEIASNCVGDPARLRREVRRALSRPGHRAHPPSHDERRARPARGLHQRRPLWGRADSRRADSRAGRPGSHVGESRVTMTIDTTRMETNDGQLPGGPSRDPVRRWA